MYHADDLTLGQPVALKLMPERLARDPERLRGLKAEVRISRQISHPNVCRVHDITEADGWVTILTATVTTDLLGGFALTSDLSAWYACVTFLAVGACLALAGYGFRVCLGRRPAFGDPLAER